MKSTLVCPKCQSRQIWIIDEVRQPRCDDMSVANPVNVTSVERPSYRLDVGRFEAWVCVKCGFTEWYAKLADAALTMLAQDPASGVRMMDTTSERGPFR